MTDTASSAEQSWAPICSMSASTLPHQPGPTVQGILYVWVEDRTLYANAGRSMLRLGDTQASLWHRSLLNPFLLMTWMPHLQAAYPTLTDAHYAVMMGNNAPSTSEQCRLLQEITHLTSRGNHPEAIPGLALAHQLYQQTCEPVEPTHALLQELLAYLLYREDFQMQDTPTIPDIAISPVEIAQLYHALVLPMTRDILRQCPDELTDVLNCWDRMGGIMGQYPQLIGGSDRLDTRMVQTARSITPTIPLIAMEDSPQLLCIGIGPNERFADGLGIYLRLAPGTTKRNPIPAEEMLALILAELLTQLGLARLIPEATSPANVDIQFHFNCTGSLNQV